MSALAELARSFNEQIQKSNTVVLSEKVLGISGLTELLAPFVPNQKSVLVKTSEQAILEGEVVSFHGTLDFLNNQNSPLQVTLKIQNGDLTLRLDITPTKSATLLDDFPILRTDQDYPGLLNVERYIFSTDSNSSTLQTGLNLEVVSKPFPYLERVASLIPGANSLKQIKMKGHISFASNSAHVDLALDIGTPEMMNFGLIKLSEGKVSLELSTRSNERKQWIATAAVYLSGTIEVANLNVPVKAQFTPSGILFIDGTPAGGNTINLTDLAGLFGSAVNLNDMLPNPLQKLGTLSLERVMLILDLAKVSIIGTAVDIQLQNWQAYDFIKVNNILAKWQWYASDKSFDLMVMGVARIRDKVDIEVEINSQPAISGAVRIDKGKSLESLVSDITGDTLKLGKFKDIEIGFIKIAANLKQSTLGFGLGAIADVIIAPGINLKQFEVDVQLAKEPSDNLIHATGNFQIGNTPIFVTSKLGAQEGGTFIGDASRVTLTQLAENYLTDLPIQNLPEITLENVHLELSATGKFKFEASIDIDLGSIGDSLGVPKTVGIPEISLERIAIEVEPITGSWSLEITSNKIYQFPRGGNNHADLSQVVLNLSKQQNNDIAIDLSLTLAGKVSLGEILGVEFKSMMAKWNSSQSSWGVEGEVECQLFGTKHKLIPDFIGSTEGTALKLTYESEIPLTIIKKIAAVTIEEFYICVENQESEEQGEQTDWGVGGACKLNLFPLMKNTPADLFLKTGSNGSEFGFSIGALSPIALDLAAGVKAKIGLQPFEIKYGKVEDKSAQWQAKGGGSLSLINIPKALNKYFPIDELSIELGFGSDEVFVRATDFTLSQNLPKLRVELPGDLIIDLGQPAVSVEELTLHFGDDLRLSQQLTVSGLKEINRIFGVNENGEPKQIILNPEFPSELSISVEKGISMRIKDSPFNPIPTREEEDGSIWTKWWQIGDIINVSIQVPEFIFDTNTATWSASGGILKKGEIKFPLSPLKWLLKLLKIDKDLVDLVPNVVPISSPGGDALKLLKNLTAMSGSNASKFEELVDKIASRLERLPLRFTEYLTAEIPDGFQFKIETSMTGNIKFDINVGAPNEENPKPIKFMFPCSAPLPEIIGVSLKSISLGELFGGSILLLEFDGHVDRFALENLIGSCLLPSEIMSKDTANSLSYRIIGCEVTTLIPAAAGVPFPIPVFYKEFGIEYHHLSGLQLNSHFYFPKPKVGFLGAIDLITKLIQFLTNKDYLLHKQDPPEGFDLEFTLGENYIGLPSFIKSEPMGLTKSLPPVSAYKNVSRLLDSTKTGNMNLLIESVPVEHYGTYIRIGDKTITFGPMSLSVGWCITTKEEFRELQTNQEMKSLMSKFEGKTVLRALPTANEIEGLNGSSAYEKGFIILLAGTWDALAIIDFNVKFGMVLTAEKGFGTGMLISGEIKDVFKLEFQGDLQVNPADKFYSLKGHQYLSMFNVDLLSIEAEVTFDTDNFRAALDLSIGGFSLIAPELIVGKLPSERLGIAIQMTWFDGATKQAFELGYSDKKLALITSLTVIDVPGLKIAGEAVLIFIAGLPEFHIQASIDIANGLLKGEGKSWFIDGRFGLELSCDFHALACTVSAETGITVPLDADFVLSIIFEPKILNDLSNSISGLVTSELDSVSRALEEKQNQLDKNNDKLKSVTLDWDDFKKPFLLSCDEIKKVADSRVNKLPGVVKKASGPFTSPFYKALASVKAFGDQNWHKVEYQHLNQAIDRLLSTVQQRIPYPATKWKKKLGIPYPVYYTKYLKITFISSTQTAYLKQAKELIKDKKGKVDFEVKANVVAQTALNEAKSSVERINGFIQFEVKELKIQTRIALLSGAELKCTASVTIAGKTHFPELAFNADPKAMAMSIFKAVT